MSWKDMKICGPYVPRKHNNNGDWTYKWVRMMNYKFDEVSK